MLVSGGYAQSQMGSNFHKGSRGTKFQTKDFQKPPPSFVEMIEISNRITRWWFQPI